MASPSWLTRWFANQISLYDLQEFKDGLFEIQDEGAQHILGRLHAAPGSKILDFCAGSGGKSLALAPLLQNKGLIVLHDPKQEMLDRARTRFTRHGIQNAQFFAGASKLRSLRGKFDLVLVDAPCGGSGTLRRSPESKLDHSPSFLTEVALTQREVLEKAAPFLAPEGVLAYITCSVLPEENHDKVKEFLRNHPHFELVHRETLMPQSGGNDGFFFAVLQHRQSS